MNEFLFPVFQKYFCIDIDPLLIFIRKNKLNNDIDYLTHIYFLSPELVTSVFSKDVTQEDFSEFSEKIISL